MIRYLVATSQNWRKGKKQDHTKSSTKQQTNQHSNNKWKGMQRSGSAFALHVKGPGFDPRHLQNFFSKLICVFQSLPHYDCSRLASKMWPILLTKGFNLNAQQLWIWASLSGKLAQSCSKRGWRAKVLPKKERECSIVSMHLAVFKAQRKVSYGV